MPNCTCSNCNHKFNVLDDEVGQHTCPNCNFGADGDEKEDNMGLNRYFLTFGTDPTMPYRGGWVEILAESMEAARRKFNEEYPPIEGTFRFSFAYTQEQFENTLMYEIGNLGAWCHEVII